jgi:hypothetical protein
LSWRREEWGDRSVTQPTTSLPVRGRFPPLSPPPRPAYPSPLTSLCSWFCLQQTPPTPWELPIAADGGFFGSSSASSLFSISKSRYQASTRRRVARLTLASYQLAPKLSPLSVRLSQTSRRRSVDFAHAIAKLSPPSFLRERPSRDLKPTTVLGPRSPGPLALRSRSRKTRTFCLLSTTLALTTRLPTPVSPLHRRHHPVVQAASTDRFIFESTRTAFLARTRCR